MKRPLIFFIVFLIPAAILTAAFLRFSIISDIRIPSLKITDRNGVLLREIWSSEYGTARPVSVDSLPGHFITALTVTEDKRFFRHPGIDPFAVVRALYLNISKRHVVSGGSTITQQLVRNIHHYPRTVRHKAVEAVRSILIELRYPKKRILEEYVNRIPFGNGAYGVEAASRLYFGKSAGDLSLSESAFLCAIPGSNRLYDPYRRYSSVLRRQKRILTALYLKEKITRDEYLHALNERLALYPRSNVFRAPHFCEAVRAGYGAFTGELRTTLDYPLQEKVEYILSGHIARLKNGGVTNGAAVVLDNASGEILAMAGSADFFNENHGGQNNGALALRQPGSSMKPFVYGTAFERGFTPADVLSDIDTSIPIDGGGFFIPQNYDKEFHGMVRARTALACSYNVATVNLAALLGEEAVLNALHKAGFDHLDKTPRFYGPGLCLGTGEVTLLELARAYSALANGGRLKETRFVLSEPARERGTLFSPQAAYLVTSILSDNSARQPVFGEYSPLNMPFPCAAKTGTSKNFRDNWTAGYTRRYTVAVWVGNFDGAPMHSVSGISGAGPIFRDLMFLLEIKNRPLAFPVPDGLEKRKICAVSGRLPEENCLKTVEEIFMKGTVPKKKCAVHRNVNIDTRNNLLAASDCPPEFREDRIFEVYPGEYIDWVRNTGIEQPPQSISSLPGTGIPSSQNAGTYNIVFPNNGDIFEIDPVLRREYQKITLTPAVDENVVSLEWRIDGETRAPSSYPFTTPWPLTPGRHTISFTARLANHSTYRSPSIKITVLP